MICHYFTRHPGRHDRRLAVLAKSAPTRHIARRDCSRECHSADSIAHHFPLGIVYANRPSGGMQGRTTVIASELDISAQVSGGDSGRLLRLLPATTQGFWSLHVASGTRRPPSGRHLLLRQRR